MSLINERRLIYYEHEEHLVRRLGAAVVVLWKDLDHETRDRIIECAERVLDKKEADHFEEQLAHLIAEHCEKRPAPALG